MNDKRASPPSPAHVLQLSPSLSIEDTGDAFFVIATGEGHDITLSLDNDVAVRLAEFITTRRLPPR